MESSTHLTTSLSASSISVGSAESPPQFSLTGNRVPVREWGCLYADLEYEKMYKVGQGSYGEVFKAKKKCNGMTVAIKRMSLERCNEGFPITALREIRFLLRLRHENVVELIEAACAKYAPPEQLLSSYNCPATTPFTYPWNFFMVCEYMEHSLRGLMERSISLSVPQIKYVMLQVLRGLEYLHSRNVMHRDIKCSNILMNNKHEIKLGDFGMGTKFVPGKLMGGSKTVVTLWYRAPELLLGSDYSEAIDIWALGCVFAELLTNDALFKGKDDQEQLLLIVSTLGIPTEDTWPGVTRLPNFNKWKVDRISAAAGGSNLQGRITSPKADPAAFDLLSGMLEMDPGKRITARQALAHPYFAELPMACGPQGMPEIAGDSHEFLLRIQQANRCLVEASSLFSASLKRDSSEPQRRSHDFPQGGSDLKPKRRREESGLLEPSTKESASMKQ